MNLAITFRRSAAAAIIGMVGFASGTAVAQEEPSESHLQAARQAIDAIGATDQFDNILPGAAARLKSTLIQATPNYQQQISDTVDETAIALASRRADLEREAASIYARHFSEAELEAITEFYTSEAGQKLLQTGPQVTQQLIRAAEIWANGIQRDLATQTDAALEEALGGQAPSLEDAGVDPATGAAE